MCVHYFEVTFSAATMIRPIGWSDAISVVSNLSSVAYIATRARIRTPKSRTANALTPFPILLVRGSRKKLIVILKQTHYTSVQLKRR